MYYIHNGKKTFIKTLQEKKLTLFGDLNSDFEAMEVTEFSGIYNAMHLEQLHRIRGKQF